MDSYQRAVTPTTGVDTANSGLVRGKILSYQGSQMRRVSGGIKVDVLNPALAATGYNATASVGSVSGGSVGSSATGSGASKTKLQQQAFPASSSSSSYTPHPRAVGVDMNVQGRSAAGAGVGIGMGATGGGGGLITGAGFRGGLPAVPGSNSNNKAGGVADAPVEHASAQSLASLPRYDLYPLSDEIPSDGIIFAKVRNQADSLVVFRTPEERLRNPERLNLDRRQLDVCPLLEQEQRLRLLNFQNNNIRVIQNLENLPNLIFLDLYNNKLVSLEGPISSVKGLRVLMAGKNRISAISNLTALRKLDVLDLHSNEIRLIEGLAGLTDLRVLNLAGNRISTVHNLSSLQALTELNLRRNNIESVAELEKLPALQRIFLSHNLLASFNDVQCLFSVKFLIELSLDGNPLSDSDPALYRNKIVGGIDSLRHLDLKRITDVERTQAIRFLSAAVKEETVQRAGQPPLGNADKSAGASAGGAVVAANTPGIPAPLQCANDAWAASTDNGFLSPELSVSDAGDVNKVSTLKASDSSDDQSGLAALARSGRITANHCLFDLELIAPNEKALIAVGDTWEWVQAKRLLVNVTEASLYHMKKEVVTGKFSPNASWLPGLKCLRLVNNDLESLKDVGSVIESFGRSMSALEHLVIMDNPICLSSGLLRHYVSSVMPNLKSFNEIDITVLERAESSRLLAPVLKIYDLATSQQQLIFGQFHLAVTPGSQSFQVDIESEQDQQQPLLPPPQHTVRSGSTVGLRGKLTGSVSAPNKRPGASMGSRSSPAIGSEQAVNELIADMSANAVNSTQISAKFDEALLRAVKKIFVDCVALC